MPDDRALYHRAVGEVLDHRKASASFLQRRLGVSYTTAAGFVERMEREGLVAAPDHVGRRAVLVDRDDGAAWVAKSASEGRCPEGHKVPEVAFDPKVGCVVLGCAYRKRPKDRGRLAQEEEEDERRHLERRALRGLRAIPEAEPVDLDAPPLAAWPAELDVDEAGALTARDLPLPTTVDTARPRTSEEIASDRLRQIIERLEALKAQKAEIAAIEGDVRAFAKAIGFSGPGITAVLKMRAQDPEKRVELEAIIETYRHALGIEGPDFAIPLPPASTPIPPPPRRLTAREEASRKALLLGRLERQSELEG